MEIGVTERFPVVALVSSAGGLDALTRVLAPLPRSFPAAVIALQHTSPTSPGYLAGILGRRTTLPVRAAEDLDRCVPGHVLVIPPGSHMLVGTDAVGPAHPYRMRCRRRGRRRTSCCRRWPSPSGPAWSPWC